MSKTIFNVSLVILSLSFQASAAHAVLGPDHRGDLRRMRQDTQADIRDLNRQLRDLRAVINRTYDPHEIGLPQEADALSDRIRLRQVRLNFINRLIESGPVGDRQISESRQALQSELRELTREESEIRRGAQPSHGDRAALLADLSRQKRDRRVEIAVLNELIVIDREAAMACPQCELLSEISELKAKKVRAPADTTGGSTDAPQLSQTIIGE